MIISQMAQAQTSSVQAESRLKKTNTVLAVFLFLIGFYILVWPLIPAISWWVKNEAPIVSSPNNLSLSVGNLDIPKDNTLILPRLNLSEKILEGESVKTVNRGIWRRPLSSTPDNASNTVLVGHRFTYGGQAVFYNLDKIQVNDQIIVYWDGKAYEYRVESLKVVPPSAVDIESSTNTPILTIYTCTPVWSAKDRLVVRATLESTL